MKLRAILRIPVHLLDGCDLPMIFCFPKRRMRTGIGDTAPLPGLHDTFLSEIAGYLSDANYSTSRDLEYDNAIL